jgi:hypothetical protein
VCVDVSVTNVSGTVSVPTMSMEMEQVLKLWRVEESDSEFSLFDFDQIADATDNFSDDHKLGQGGFGPVYKVGARRTTYCCVLSAACSSCSSLSCRPGRPSINWRHIYVYINPSAYICIF